MWLPLFVLLAQHCFGEDSPKDKIKGGVQIPKEAVPWTAQYGDTCGGSILASRWIITAAHCGEQPFVRVKSSEAGRGGEVIRVSEHYPHENYDEPTLDNNLQMVKLLSEINFDQYAQPIEIGDASQIKPGAEVGVVGWGQSGEKEVISESLLSFSVPITNMSYCQENYDTVTERMFCAGHVGQGMCESDSGGPATIGNKLVGVLSHGAACFIHNTPGVYGNVPSAKEWIHSHINKTPPTHMVRFTNSKVHTPIQKSQQNLTGKENKYNKNKSKMHSSRLEPA